LLTRQEKEKAVVELYKQNKTIRQIAKEVHMSFGDICAIINREFGSKDLELSKDNLVLKCFAKGESPLEVAIKFDIPVSQVQRLHKEYQNLSGMQELNKIYDELGDEIQSVIQLYKTMKKQLLTPEEITNTVRYANDLPVLQLKYEKMEEELDQVESKKINLISEIQVLENAATVSNKVIASLDKVLESRKNKIQSLDSEIQKLQGKILWMMGSKDYTKIRDIARQQVETILNDRRALLLTTLAAVIEAFKLDPEKQILLSNITDGNPSYYIDQRKELLELAEQNFNGLTNDLVRVTMNSIFDRQAVS
jgi:chromosome segregation ATPase